MGVDWYTCTNCQKTFPDAGHYGYCSKCEEIYCGDCYDKFVKKYGEIDESHNRYNWYGESLIECDHCNGTVISVDDLLEFALDKLNMGRDELEKEYRETL